MTTNDGAQRAPGHLLPLDGVRGLAVLIVVIHNSAWVGTPSDQFLAKLTLAITATGWSGVQLFFALSGFLITGILLDAKGKPRYFSSFYARRTLRIFPLYYVFLALTVFVAPLISWSPEWIDSVKQHQWFYWLYLSSWTQPFTSGIHGLSHLWSLSVEEQFYLAWPLLVWFLSRRGLVNLCLAMIIGTPFIRLTLRLLDLPEATAYMFPISRWDALAAGALVAALLRDDLGRLVVAKWRGRVTVAAAMALALQVGILHGLHSDGVAVQVIGQSLVAILSASLIVFAVEGGRAAPSRLQAALSQSWIRTLGKYSYAMYVFHFPIHHALRVPLEEWVRVDDTPWLLVRLASYLLLVLTLTLLAAMISWRLIEKPFLDLKDRIAPRAS